MNNNSKLPQMYQSLEPFKGNPANFTPLTPLAYLSRTADIFPEHCSLIYENQHYTWAQTHYRCQQMAAALKSLGITKFDTVSILAFNTPHTFEAHFYIPLAGAVINAINTRLDAETIRFILSHAQSKALIVDLQLLPQALEGIRYLEEHHQCQIPIIIINDPYATETPNLPNDIKSYDYEELLNTQKPDKDQYLPCQVDDELSPLAINFTSGTSGLPKGVVYHHRGSYLMTMGTISGWSLPQHPVYLYTVPLFHCNGWGHAWTMTAVAATVICVRNIIPKAIFTSMQTHRVTHFGGAPIVLNMLANAPECPDRIANDRLIYCMTAGAPPPAAVLEKMQNTGFEIMHVYGLTESYGHILQATPQKSWNNFKQAKVAELKARQGVRFPMTESVQVINVISKAAVPNDGKTLGEIVIRSNTMMSGYLKDPEATNTAFNNGWFHSGDLAVVHKDGYIQIKDRAKDIIISGGENISSVEIENALYKHPAVGEAAVVAMPDEKWGEVPCAFIELNTAYSEHESMTEQILIDHCAEHIARFKKPKKIIFGVIPKTGTGKIQKFQLRKQLVKDYDEYG